VRVRRRVWSRECSTHRVAAGRPDQSNGSSPLESLFWTKLRSTRFCNDGAARSAFTHTSESLQFPRSSRVSEANLSLVRSFAAFAPTGRPRSVSERNRGMSSFDNNSWKCAEVSVSLSCPWLARFRSIRFCSAGFVVIARSPPTPSALFDRSRCNNPPNARLLAIAALPAAPRRLLRSDNDRSEPSHGAAASAWHRRAPSHRYRD